MRFCFNGRINPNLRELKIRSAKQTKKNEKRNYVYSFFIQSRKPYFRDTI